MAYTQRRGLGAFPDYYDSCCARNDHRCPENTRMANEIENKLVKLRRDLNSVNWRGEGRFEEGSAAFELLEKVEDKLSNIIRGWGMHQPGAANSGFPHYCGYHYSIYRDIKKDVEEAVFEGEKAIGVPMITPEEEMQILNQTLPPAEVEPSFIRRNAKPLLIGGSVLLLGGLGMLLLIKT